MAGKNVDEQAIFEVARKIDSPEARQAYLQQMCGDDLSLQQRIQALLRAYEENASFLESPPPELGTAPTIDQPITEKPGAQIGPYKLLEQIGEGGMGVVYMAEQTEPVQRRVALKIIKPGMDTRQVIGRFEAERQALAMMDHPNIAKVLDAGTTESGRPYFVMELVGGTPITQYADEHQLTPRDRLELFVPVCQAVQHAHQKGIIHRDIKPSNVLVAEYDDRPVPKVIDFGVAKAIEKRLTEKTMFTRYGQIVGTIDYMSPEQANLNQLDIDTRSDVYSLGVLLYELLTGETPFDRVRLRSAAFDELLRIIREEDPPKPSLRLSTSDSLPSTAANRKIEPKKLSTLISGELDWIVMKALEKDRTRRYETANGFARDIQRYLDDEPVEACPPSTAYRFRKFVRRNKVALATASIVALALVVGLLGTTWQAFRAMKAEGEAKQQRELAEQQRELAEQRLTEVDKQRQRAEANFQKAMEAVDQMLSEVGEKQLAEIPQMESVRRSLLEKALEFYEGFLQENSSGPQVRLETGRAHGRVGHISRLLGDNERAEEASRNAIKVFQKLEADYPSERVNRHDLARGHRQLGQIQLEIGQLKEAEESFRAALRVSPECRGCLALAYGNLGRILCKTGRYPEAEDSYRQALSISQQLVHDFPEDPEYRESLAEIYGALSRLLWEAGQYEESEKHGREALSIRQQLVHDSPERPDYRQSVASSQQWLGRVLRETGRNEEVEEVLSDALSICQQLVRDFPEVPSFRQMLAVSHSGLGKALENMGRYEEAEKAYREAINIRQQLVRDLPDVPAYRDSLAGSLQDLAVGLGQTGRNEEAEKNCREVLSIQQQLCRDFPEVPEYRLNVSRTYLNLGNVLGQLGRTEEAVKAYRESLSFCQQLTRDFPDDRDMLGMALNNLGNALSDLGRNEEAEKAYRESLSIQQQLVRDLPEVPSYRHILAGVHCNLGNVLRAMGQYEEATTNYREAIRIGQQLVRDFPNVRTYDDFLLNSLDGIGSVWQATGGEEAIKNYREQISFGEQLVRDFPEVPGYRDLLWESWFGLGLVLLATGDVEGYRQHCAELLKRYADSDDPQVPGWKFAWCCKLAPIAPDDLEQVVKLAEKSVAESPEDGLARHELGCVLYRAGRFEEAAELVGRRDDAWCSIWQAMIHHRLGHSQQAREFFAEASEHMDKRGNSLELELKLLRKEAAALLGIDDEADPKKEKPNEQAPASGPA